jgi:hypothetical protein
LTGRDRWLFLAAGALAVALQVLAILSQSLVGDATYHLVAGHQALRHGTNTLNLEHPPLVKLVAALPLLGLDPGDELGPRLEPSEALTASRRVYDRPDVLRRGRIGGRALVLLVFGLPWLVACWFLGRAIGGPGGGRRLGWLLALAVALSIGVLPYVSILQTDVALALGFALALLGAVRYVERPALGAAAVLGAGLGIGLAAKLSAPLMIPALGVALALGAVRRDAGGARRGWKLATADLLVVAGIGLAVPSATYALANHDYDPVAGREAIVQYVEGRGTLIVENELRPWRETLLSVERVSPGSAQWLTGLLGIAAQNRLGIYPSFAFGKVDSGGRWWYFPAVFLVKTPLVLLMMLGAALLAPGIARRGGKPVAEGARAAHAARTRRAVAIVLVVAGTVYLAAALTSSYNIGVRHLLPITPLLYLPAAAWAARRRWRSSILVGALAVEAVLVAPLWMSATNTWWLGYANPTRWSLGTSDLEYRQNFLVLAGELERRGIERVGVLYPGLPPEVVNASLPGGFVAKPGVPIRPGWYAINVTVEQYVPALLRADPADLRSHDTFLRLARSWNPYWRGLVDRAEDHGYVAGTFHLVRVPPQPSEPPR